MDVSQLSPEEKDRLLTALIAKVGIDLPGEQPGHTDAQADAEQLAPIIKVLEMVIDKFEALEERVECLDKLVTEEIIGGITKLYNEKSRAGGISSMMDKYKDKFDPYKDFYGEMTDGSDLYEKLFDEINEMKGSNPEWNDEVEGSKVGELADILKSKFEKVKGMGAPVEASIEVAKIEPENADGLDKIRTMRKNFGTRTLG